MQPVAVSAGAMLLVVNMATPESLSDSTTVPAAKAFALFAVCDEKAALVAWNATRNAANTARTAADIRIRAVVTVLSLPVALWPALGLCGLHSLQAISLSGCYPPRRRGNGFQPAAFPRVLG